MITEKKAVVRAATELAYGSPPAMTDANTVYVENFNVTLKRDALARPGLAGGREGWGSAPGMEQPEWSGEIEILPVSLNVGSGTTPVLARPLHHTWLTMMGFVLVDSTANTLLWELRDSGYGSGAIEFYRKDEDGIGGQLWTAAGCRADGVLRWSKGERYMASMTGRCKTLTPEDDGTLLSPVYLDQGYVATVLSPASRLPLVAIGASAALIPPTGAPYAGGVIDFECRLRQGLQTPRIANGASGTISKVLIVPEGPIEIDLSVEAVPYNDFNPYQLRDRRTRLDMILTLEAVDAPAGTRDLHDTEATVTIKDVETRMEEGRLVWKLMCEAVWQAPGIPDPQLRLRSRSIAS
jgi:hypothetical protein